jgi:hypothetical protein
MSFSFLAILWVSLSIQGSNWLGASNMPLLGAASCQRRQPLAVNQTLIKHMFDVLNRAYLFAGVIKATLFLQSST